MKRIFLSLLLVIPIIAFADEIVTINGVEEPQWKDFAPPAFIDIKEPRGVGRFNDTASYWYKRKTGCE